MYHKVETLGGVSAAAYWSGLPGHQGLHACMHKHTLTICKKTGTPGLCSCKACADTWQPCTDDADNHLPHSTTSLSPPSPFSPHPHTRTHACTHTHLLDHDTGEVAVLEGGVGRVLGGQLLGQLQIELVQFVHLLQRQLHLAGPVGGDKPAGEEGDGKRDEEEER